MSMDIKVAKLDTVVSFVVEDFPPASLEYVIRYGLTQALNDAHASVQRKAFKTEAEFINVVGEKVQKRAAQIRSGDVPGSRAPADPAKRRAQMVAYLSRLSPEDRKQLLKDAQAAMGA